MYSEDTQNLPISLVLPSLCEALRDADEAVLQAPPGAGKTTVVPLALLQEPWLQGQTVLVLEPRRMAARAAATRMAQLLDEEPGATVGYRIRLDSCVSRQTRIEVITEGILTRRLQSDPGLEGVGAVIFDEFHERNLDSDLCLALALQGREVFREGPPLKLLLMSATLDGEAAAELLGGAPVVTSEGRQYPVQTHFGAPHQLRDSIVAPVTRTVLQALKEQSGSILVFLPGQREISAVGRELSQQLQQHDMDNVQVAPLYGGLSMERQQAAIRPAGADRRKVVLSTNVAETSLTIEGVDVVVDSGLVREAVFDPATGMTRLATRRISRASAEQRQGRAGRLGPGHCYRVWSEEQHKRLVAHGMPEILQADLAPLALQLLAWGVNDPTELAWLDVPPPAPYQQAVDVLRQCGALYSNRPDQWQLTPHGVRLAQMPLHPRLAHMLLVGCDIQASETACLVAAVLSERNPLGGGAVDMSATLAVLMGESRCPPRLQGWFRRIWQQARRFARLATEVHKPQRASGEVPREDVLGVLLASAYPDRVARLRDTGDRTEYRLANGRSARLPADDALAGSDWLAVAEIGGHVGESSDRIFSATQLQPSHFSGVLSGLPQERELVEWDKRSDQFIAERQWVLGRIVLSAAPLLEVSEEARGQALLGMLRDKGLQVLPWTPGLQQWRARVQLLHDHCPDSGDTAWPDLSEQALLATLEAWLLPFLGPVRKLQDFKQLDLRAILQGLLPWPLPLELERLAPERIAVPSGSNIPVDYNQQPPVLAVKLQEMFGCEDAPLVADGKVALQVHLLSPAGRPLQVTQDLAGFWRGAYAEVRKEMKGRYPKHPWPEDPLVAAPTRYTKRRAG